MESRDKNGKYVIESLRTITAQLDEHSKQLAHNAVHLVEMESRLKVNSAKSEAKLLAEIQHKFIVIDSLKTRVALISGGITLVLTVALTTAFKFFF